MPTVGRAADVSEQVLEAVRKGQETALEAVRKFMDTVDQAVPSHSVGPTKRREIIDSAFQMAERLVGTQHEFIQNVVRSSAKFLTEEGEESKPKS